MPSGDVELVAGSYGHGFKDGTGIDAWFSHPTGLDIEANGDIIVSDFENHRIRKVTPAGVVTTIAGSLQSFAEGTGENAYFNSPLSVRIDAAGNYLVTDFY